MNKLSSAETPIEKRLAQFESTLKQTELPIEKWTGEEGTKTVKDLFDEVDAGETELEISPTGEVARVVHVVAGDITYFDTENGRVLRLREDRQVFNVDGKVKRRSHLKGAVAEKIKVGEDPVEATLRGIQEELGLTGDFEIGDEEVIEETRETPTYPGLTSTYKIHKIPAKMSSENFDPNGYKEVQPDKTTYFVWDEVNQ